MWYTTTCGGLHRLLHLLGPEDAVEALRLRSYVLRKVVATTVGHIAPERRSAGGGADRHERHPGERPLVGAVGELGGVAVAGDEYLGYVEVIVGRFGPMRLERDHTVGIVDASRGAPQSPLVVGPRRTDRDGDVVG